MALPFYYNWRNLLVRRLSTLLTFSVVAVIVAVLTVLLSFSEGIRASLRATGSSMNMIVLKTGATAESTSIISPEESVMLVQTPGIARNAGGKQLLSLELCVQTSVPRKANLSMPANVAIRGVEPIALEVHPEVRIVAGRMFDPAAMEVIVGKAAGERYANLAIGDEVEIGRANDRKFKVVGEFTAAGSALESEIWASRTVLGDSYNRRFMSSAVMRLESRSAADAAFAFVHSPAVNLRPRLETDYYEELTSKTREIVALTTILISIMSIGAIFAVANTMYATVDGRRREIAMLRTIGFGRGAIVGSFVIESLLICTAACICGLGLSFFMNGSRQDFLSDMTWTVLAYELRITPRTVMIAFGLAAFVAVAGALAPSLRASRIRIIEALRKG